MGRPQQKPQPEPHAAQAGLKIVDNAKVPPSGEAEKPKAPARDEAAVRRRLHPARVWPD